MKAVWNAFTSPESPLSTPADWVLHLFGGGETWAGKDVTEQTAMQNSTVYRCITLIAQSIASLPFGVVRSEENQRTPVTNHPVATLLGEAPNEWMTPVVFWEHALCQVLATGNHYSAIATNGSGQPIALNPYTNPRAVKVTRDNGRLRYAFKLLDGSTEVLDQAQVFHLAGPGFDGFTGMSVVTHAAKEAIALALATEEHGARLFRNGARTGGVLKHPKALSEDAKKLLSSQWKDMMVGNENAHRTAILEEGMEYQPMTMTAEEAQFLGTRTFTVSDISRFFGVPLFLLNETEKSTSWGTGLEQQFIAFVMVTLRPWIVRIEQEINRKLLFEPNLSAKITVEGMLRGDSKSRSEFYSKGLQNAWLTPNEIRALEDLHPVPGGDQLYVPANIVPITQPITEEVNA